MLIIVPLSWNLGAYCIHACEPILDCFLSPFPPRKMSEICADFGTVFKIHTLYYLHDAAKEAVKGDLRSDFSGRLVPCRRAPACNSLQWSQRELNDKLKPTRNTQNKNWISILDLEYWPFWWFAHKNSNTECQIPRDEIMSLGVNGS